MTPARAGGYVCSRCVFFRGETISKVELPDNSFNKRFESEFPGVSDGGVS